MKINRNNSYQAQFTGLRANTIFGPQLTVAESVFFTLEANAVVATTFLVICTMTDATALQNFIATLSTATYADLASARRAMPKVTTLPVGMLLRTYEKETESGVVTLSHQGSFKIAFETALKGLITDGTYDLAKAQQALNTALTQCPTATIMPKRQIAVKTTRGQWIAWLDFDCN